MQLITNKRISCQIYGSNNFDKGIDWVAEDFENENYFQDTCIKFVNENFTSKVISQKYLQHNKVFK